MLIKNSRYKWFSDYNLFEYKINEVENKIPDNNSLATTAAYNTKIWEVENKIPGDAKYISTPEFIRLMAENFVAR